MGNFYSEGVILIVFFLVCNQKWLKGRRSSMFRVNSWKKATEPLNKCEIYTGHVHFISIAALAISFCCSTDSQSLIETHEFKLPAGQKKRMNLSIPSTFLQLFSQNQNERFHVSFFFWVMFLQVSPRWLPHELPNDASHSHQLPPWQLPRLPHVLRRPHWYT